MQTDLKKILTGLREDTVLKKEYILDNVLPKLSSVTRMEKLSEKNVYLEHFMDMALSFYVPFDMNAIPDSLVSFSLTMDILRKTGITPSELKSRALDNLEKEYDICPLCDLLEGMGFGSFEAEPVTMLVVTTKNRMHGASLMISRRVLSLLHERLGDFFILPSSIHEFISLPYDDTTDINILANMVSTINETEVAPAERLSNNVYMWDGQLIKNLSSNPPEFL
ncbi:MAG TPA: hypothetical protein DCL38_08170 [Lachnospiraceae bacterium]|nr:hypothetical protein [Lachnospiraceae bacterium]